MVKDQPIVMLTHGGWGQHLLSSVEMIMGKCEGIYEVALNPEDNLQDYITKVENKLKELTWEGSLLILTDIKGGTTSNVALRLSKDYNLLVVSGLTTSMLLEAAMKRQAPFSKEIVQEIIVSTIDNCQLLEVQGMKEE